jgi:three-Cys-motif partner protein
MVALEDYADREPSYVKHVFLERYLEALFFKTASTYPHIVYVDGFAGPWQSANENFEDTSFGIALSALRKAKQSWKERGRAVKMTALLVEVNPEAYAKLATLPAKYPDISIKTYPADFITVVPGLLNDIPRGAFAFFFIDPKGWRIPLERLRTLLSRSKSEVLFNFMFEFINRAASMSAAITIEGLNELMPGSNWQQRLLEAEEQCGRYGLTMDDRKEILVAAFGDSLKQLGGYPYIAELTVLRPLKDRALYCLVYASHHESGISVFRDCQMAALKAQAGMRAEGKVRNKQSRTGQNELFESMLDMAPDKTEAMFAVQKSLAAAFVLELVPEAPKSIPYHILWATVLAKHAIRRTDVNAICAAMKKSGKLFFPDWEPRKHVPQDNYRVQRPK